MILILRAIAERGRGKTSGRKKKQARGAKPDAAKQAALNGPITPAERAYFQSLLSQLHDHHLQLYNEFRSTAVWKQAEGTEEDDVDLDDKNTSPKVFRRMIGWCRHVLQENEGPGKEMSRQGSGSVVDGAHLRKRVGDGFGGPKMKRTRTEPVGDAKTTEDTAGTTFHDDAVSESSSSSDSSSSSSDSDSSDVESGAAHAAHVAAQPRHTDIV